MIRRKRLAPLALFLLLAAGLLWWRSAGGGAVSGELLRKNPPFIPSLQAVRNGRLLWGDAAPEPHTFLVRQMDVRDGKPRDLFRRPLKGEVVLRTLFTRTELLYLTAPAFPRAERDASRGVVSAGGRRLYLSGPYLMPEKKGQIRPGETWRVISRPCLRNQPSPTLHRVSLESGEEKQTVRLDAQGYCLGTQLFTLGEDGVYWLRPGSQARTVVIKKERTAYELLPPQDDLMVTPLDGSPARPIARGVLLGWLDARGDGIYGARLPAYPEMYSDGDLYRFSRSGDLPATRLPYGMRVGGQRLDARPGGVESDGRYYWLNLDPEADGVVHGIPASSAPARLGGSARGRTNTGPVQLMSCRVDGSDARLVCALVDKRGEGLYPESLFTYQGRPYLICSQIILPSRGGGDALPQVAHYIVRVHPEAQDPLGGMRRLGVGRGTYDFSGLVDDGYYYFSLNDVERSPLDFLAAKSTEHHVDSFWRVRLPE